VYFISLAAPVVTVAAIVAPVHDTVVTLLVTPEPEPEPAASFFVVVLLLLLQATRTDIKRTAHFIAT